MSQAKYDAIVIGGGPGGSAASTYLARDGKRVLVLEKARFPRFHIGESLLPYNLELFEEMGFLPKLEAAGFTLKVGAQFHLGNRTKALKLVFKNGAFTRHTRAFQVERARFDQLLLQHASASGAEVREGWTVTGFSRSEDSVTVQARNEAGATETFTASFLLDASGRANVTGNLAGLRVTHPKLKKLSIFGHFEGVELDDGTAAGDTFVVRLENKWFWLIPLTSTKTSVGCVMDQEEFARAKRDPADLFEEICRSSAEMRARMRQARLVMPLQTTSDFSYHNQRLAEPRLLRIGDAAGFVDPIFSSGVYLAMYSGRLAARTVSHALAAGNGVATRLKLYERRVFAAMRLYREMVEAFYTQPFMELFMEPRPKYNLPDTIVAILAGELEGGWSIRWRLKIFYFLIRLQARWPLVPKLSFAEHPAGKAAPPPVEVNRL